MLEMFFILLAVFVAYLVAVSIVVKRTTDKMGARSGLFGAGLVSIVFGFILYAVVGEIGLAVGYDYWDETPSTLYYVARFGFLILGISGIVMVAVDLLKTIGAMGGYISSLDDKIKKNAGGSVPPKQEPTWKRIQMDDEK